MKNENTYLIQLGAEVKKHRIALKISQEQLALICAFDRTYISLIECGKRNISYLNLLKLTKGLKTNISILTKRLK